VPEPSIDKEEREAPDAPTLERRSHLAPGVIDRARLREEIRDREHQQLLHRVIWMRAVFLPIAAIFLTLVVLLDKASWKVGVLAVVVALLLAVSVLDWLRLRRDDSAQHSSVYFNLGVAALLQTGAIWMTGALESPLVVVYVPVAMIVGITLGPNPGRNVLLGLISLLLWLMALSGLLGWVPRTVPSFLDLGPGFYDRTIYVLTKTAVLNVVIVVAALAGTGLHRGIERMLDQAIVVREQALEALADRNRELVYLSSAIAHELKNPLASIQGLVQLLDRRGAEERQGARLEVLRKEIARMRDTLDEFLNFSRPLGELTLEVIDLTTLVAEIDLLHEGLAQARQLTVVSPPGGLTLRCDARKIKQALINLLQNALEATPPGGEITWVARRAASFVELGVRDTGPGLPREILERSAVGSTTKPGGSGIGLAVARAIAEQHGGALVAENLPQGGCQVLLRLPETES
jgi:two-component system, NtrC family, sensor histidine kinase HydH